MLATIPALALSTGITTAASAQSSSWAWCSSSQGAFHSFPDGLALYNQENSGSGPQTICGNSGSDWQATTNDPAGRTAVLSYPDVQLNFGKPYPLVSSLSASNTSSFAENMNTNQGTSAEAAYDIWLNRGTGGSRDEVMIWVDTFNRGTVGGASQLKSGLSFCGQNTWQLWQDGKELIWYLPQNEQSGSVCWTQMLQYLQSPSLKLISSKDTLSQFEFGWEICSTGGVNETFQVTSYSVTINGVTYGSGSPAAATRVGR